MTGGAVPFHCRDYQRAIDVFRDDAQIGLGQLHKRVEFQAGVAQVLGVVDVLGGGGVGKEFGQGTTGDLFTDRLKLVIRETTLSFLVEGAVQGPHDVVE